MARFQNALPLIGLALVASACSSSDDDSSAGVTVEQQMDTARTGYADLMFAMYSDVTDLAIDLQTAIDTFVATPNAANFQAAKDAWLLARPFYQQTEVGRFYDGPIDDADGPEGEINAWPLDENYIDYVSGDPMGMPSGIVNDTAITIDEATLRAANGVGGDANIATGWHAIEFLLWGQDFDVNGPGARPLSDYDGADNNDDRRGAYLSLVAQLLVNDLTSVRDEWAPGTGTYRQTFTSEPVRTSIEKIMTGIATLGVGELRGERILVPFNSQSQEDEHSCFSDTTDLDHTFDLVGIRNVWRGEYDAFDSTYDFNGIGLDSVFQVGSPSLGTALGTAIDNAVTALEAQVTPFDQAILAANPAGRAALQNAIDVLSDYNVAISAAASALNLTITSSI